MGAAGCHGGDRITAPPLRLPRRYLHLSSFVNLLTDALASTSAIFDSSHQIQVGECGDFRGHRGPHDGQETPARAVPPGSRRSWRQPDHGAAPAWPKWRKSSL